MHILIGTLVGIGGFAVLAIIALAMDPRGAEWLASVLGARACAVRAARSAYTDARKAVWVMDSGARGEENLRCRDH